MSFIVERPFGSGVVPENWEPSWSYADWQVLLWELSAVGKLENIKQSRYFPESAIGALYGGGVFEPSEFFASFFPKGGVTLSACLAFDFGYRTTISYLSKISKIHGSLDSLWIEYVTAHGLALQRSMPLPFLAWLQLRMSSHHASYQNLGDFMLAFSKLSTPWSWPDQAFCTGLRIQPFPSMMTLDDNAVRSVLAVDPKLLAVCIANGVLPVWHAPVLTLVLDNPTDAHFLRMLWVEGLLSCWFKPVGGFPCSLAFAYMPTAQLLVRLGEVLQPFIPDAIGASRGVRSEV